MESIDYLKLLDLKIIHLLEELKLEEVYLTNNMMNKNGERYVRQSLMKSHH